MKPRIAATALLALVATVGSFEGLRTVAYSDPVGIPTICFGATAGVQLGQTATVDQCRSLLASDLQKAARVLECFEQPLPPHQQVAVVSWAYNVGVQAACGSTLVRLANQGAPPEVWCAQLDRWVKARGIQLPGLVRRRAQERAICEGRAPGAVTA